MNLTQTDIVVPSRNCWRVAHAQRAAFLVDGEAYFEAFAAAVERAQHSIFIIGWDLDSRTRLLPGRHPRNLPTELGDFLNAVVSRRRGLHAYLLAWDYYSVVYTLERELLPSYKLGARTHRRVNFQLDSAHPLTASQHQKIVVIDDKIAFVGGLDLTIRRWDTRGHRQDDPLRVDPAGVPYKPFHDIQMMVDGDAARALGELARERWRRATGKTLTATPRDEYDPWPAQCRVDVGDVEVAIARTEPPYQSNAGVCEVKQLYLDMIAAAQRHIYIENQYFTAASTTAALAERLRAPNAPEVVIVLPRGNGGWLEESTMGLLRAHAMRELKRADRHRRLRFYYAAMRDAPDSYIQIHSKVFIVDDRVLRIGSSNLNNRSMGFDSECDLAIEGRTAHVQQAIARFRNELLAEHLSVTDYAMAQAHRQHGSLIAAIESLRGGEHTLEPLTGELPADVQLPEVIIVDPERPVAPQEVIAELVSADVRKTAKRRLLRNAILLLAILALAAAWRFTPFAQYFDLESIARWTDLVATHPAGLPALLLTFVASGLVLFPVTLLIVATALSFDPLPGFFYALTGCLLSATTNYYLGRLLGRDAIKRVAGDRLRRLNQHLIRRGLIAMITVRLVPVAPFSVINIVAGALRIRLRHLVLGTAIGMTPGILAISVFTGGIENALRNPSFGSLAVLTAVAIGIALAALWVRRWLMHAGTSADTSPP